MIELIGRPFVIICAFLAVLALLVSGAFSIIGTNSLAINQQNTLEQAQINAAFGPTEAKNITSKYVLLPPGAERILNFSVGHSISWFENNVITDASPITYIDKDNILVYSELLIDVPPYHFVMGHYYLFFHQVWGGFFGFGQSSSDYQIGIDAVMNHVGPDGVSYINVTMEKGYTLIFHPNHGTDLRTDWETHSNFNVSIGQTLLNASKMTTGDALQIIGEIMTFSVPNVDPAVNLLLAAVLMPSYLILLFFVVRSLIPLLGG